MCTLIFTIHFLFDLPNTSNSHSEEVKPLHLFECAGRKFASVHAQYFFLFSHSSLIIYDVNKKLTLGPSVIHGPEALVAVPRFCAHLGKRDQVTLQT